MTEKKSPKSIREDEPDLFIYFAHQPGSDQWKAEKNPNKVMEIFRMGQVMP